MPRRNVYVEALGGWSSLGGPFARGEVGAVLGKIAGGFLFAEADSSGTKVGGGVRVTF